MEFANELHADSAWLAFGLQVRQLPEQEGSSSVQLLQRGHKILLPTSWASVRERLSGSLQVAH
ncbi:MAG: hypothetical protein SFV17_06380 [Candidatus Obscuribacter sp.]|nr:hypothetical protein [Candidatus Obscuribacter sp.]